MIVLAGPCRHYKGKNSVSKVSFAVPIAKQKSSNHEALLNCTHYLETQHYLELVFIVATVGTGIICAELNGRKRAPPPANSFDAVIHMQETPRHNRIFVGRSSPFVRLAEHLGASCLVQSIPAWSVKTRRAPSRYRRDAMRGSMIIRLRSCTVSISSTPSPHRGLGPVAA